MADRAALNYVLIRHQDKAAAYINALRSAGYRRASVFEGSAFLFAQPALGSPATQMRIDTASLMGLPIFFYPHTARPPLYWDGIVDVPKYAASFVTAPGHEQVMRTFGFDQKIEVTGWTYCPIRPFSQRWTSARIKPLSVLFAPAHPNWDGRLGDASRKANQAAYKRLVLAHRAGKIILSMRLVHGSAEEHGCTPVAEDVLHYRNAPGLTYGDIDAADVVVATQTVAYLAIARGVPTVMIDEGATPYADSYSMGYREVKNFARYKDLLAFPYDILNGRTMEILREAAASDAKIAAWRRLFIGDPFDARVFIEKVQSYLA